METVLSNQGCRVLTAEQGFEAWRILREERPDMAILDLRLPLIDGLDLARAVQAHPELSATHLVLSTADRAEETTATALEAGIDAFLPKPFKVGDILRLVPAAEPQPLVG